MRPALIRSQRIGRIQTGSPPRRNQIRDERYTRKQERHTDEGQRIGRADAEHEVAQQATRIGYSYGFNDDALKSAQRWM